MKMKEKDIPYISPEILQYLKETFQMPTYTLDKDMRKLDFTSGQLSVIEHLEHLSKKQGVK